VRGGQFALHVRLVRLSILADLLLAQDRRCRVRELARLVLGLQFTLLRGVERTIEGASLDGALGHTPGWLGEPLGPNGGQLAKPSSATVPPAEGAGTPPDVAAPISPSARTSPTGQRVLELGESACLENDAPLYSG
jgi:hypothetical protein